VCCVPAEQGYDPFNPEVVRPQAQENGTSSDSGDLSGALDMVNKAIEEVRGEVEREKRKLSRIGDEPYDPGQRKKASSPKAVKSKKKPASHMAYDPGSYQMTSGGYNPTPGCSKYTLDADAAGNNSSSMEYVPTAVRKPLSRKHAPSPPPSPKYSSSTSSPKVKYTLDNSKPSTDMEYDPLSNYSAGIAAKSKKERGGGGKDVKTDGRKTLKPPPYIDPKKYTFSESDGESSGTEYRPYLLSSLQQRKGHRGAPWSGVGKEKEKEASEEEEKKKVAGGAGHTSREKSGKFENAVGKVANKTSGGGGRDKGSTKTSNKDYAKKENKSHGKRDERNNAAGKTPDKDNKRSEEKIKREEKVKMDSSKREKEAGNGARESKKAKILEKGRSKESNGRPEGRRREKEVKKTSKSSSSVGVKGGAAHGKDRAKPDASSANGKRRGEKRRSASLSHADLFGDESPEEAAADEEDEEEEVLVRKSADALKRGNKRKASELTPSSSDEEEEEEEEAGHADFDFSGFQDLDLDSDPMEECLRIFNESKDVRTEDKGRQLKQVCVCVCVCVCFVGVYTVYLFSLQPSRLSEEEGGAEAALTTLFPGQKKRVSHCGARGSVSLSSSCHDVTCLVSVLL